MLLRDGEPSRLGPSCRIIPVARYSAERVGPGSCEIRSNPSHRHTLPAFLRRTNRRHSHNMAMGSDSAMGRYTILGCGTHQDHRGAGNSLTGSRPFTKANEPASRRAKIDWRYLIPPHMTPNQHIIGHHMTRIEARAKAPITDEKAMADIDKGWRSFWSQRGVNNPPAVPREKLIMRLEDCVLFKDEQPITN